MELLGGEEHNNWFMPNLIGELKGAGKMLEPDHCYTFVRLPIFKEGLYEVSNLNPVPAKQHFAVTGSVHRQLKDLPDGTQVEISAI